MAIVDYLQHAIEESYWSKGLFPCSIYFQAFGSIFVWDYQKEEQLINLLIKPEDEEEKEFAFEKLKSVLLL